MEKLEVEVAVIGAGSAGLNARHEARAFGARRVVVIEGGPYGTTCARVGCMPSKLLIAAAERAHEARTAAALGVRAEVEVDGAEVMARLRRERDRFVSFVVRSVERHGRSRDGSLPEVAPHIRGRARFVGPTTLEVADANLRIEARAVVIASGSSPAIPAVLRGAGSRLLTSDALFELERLPESVAVVGAGVIGLELGQALHRLGVRTTILSNESGLGGITDPEVLSVARAVLGAELALELSATIREVREVDGDAVEVAWTRSDGSEQRERYAYVLAATGRRPNLGDLDLEATGVAVDERGVPRFDPSTMQCGELPLFVAGDVTARTGLLHEAIDDGHIAGENAALWPNVRAHRRRVPLSIVFCRPQIARVGASHAELEGGGGAGFAVGEVDYGDQGRARVEGHNAGVLRVYGERGTGRLLGAEMLAPGAEHLAHLLSWAVQSGQDVQRALGMPFYHPVLEEGLRTALRELATALRLEQARDPLYDGPAV